MEHRKLGSSELEASVIALGAWEFGNSDDFATDDQATVDTVVRSALDSGINLFDTAEGYASGRSEEMLAKALRGRRDEALIATKVIEFGEWTKEMILDRLKGSLQRLEIDRIDLYQMHWPKGDFTAADAEIMMDAFGEALRDGLVRYVGVSNFRQCQLDLLEQNTIETLITNQVPLSLLWRFYDVEGATEFCEKSAVSYLVYSPIAQGFLTGKFSETARPSGGAPASSKWASDELYPGVMAVVDTLKEVAAECSKTPAQVALNWVIYHENVGAAIVGTRKPEHLQDNLGAVGWRLDPGLAERLEKASIEFQKSLNPEWQSIWGPG